MRVLSSELSLGVETSKTRSIKTHETSEFWRTPTATPARNEDVVRLSDEARAAAGRDPAQVDDTETGDPLTGDPRLQLLRTLIEAATGRKLRLLSNRELSRAPEGCEPLPTATAEAPQRTPEAPRRLGWGFVADIKTVDAQHERSEFTARGAVRTEDGRQLTLETKLVLTRDRVDVTTVHIEAGDKKVKDPLLLDLGEVSSDLQAGSFDFDLNSDGRAERVQRIGAGSAFLVDDANGDGRANDGTELFGARSGDGFAELAALDADQNGWIDEGDAAWQRLRVWTPDAQGQGSLRTLSTAGVGAIAVAHASSPFDLRDADGTLRGQVRATGVYLTESGQMRTARQVDLRVDDPIPAAARLPEST